MHSQSQHQLLGDTVGVPELTDVSPASSYGEEADVEGVEIAGKEGTSSIEEPQRYSHKEISLITPQPYIQEEEFSPLLSLPMEILIRVLEYVYVDTDISSINSNLENFANTVPLLSKNSINYPFVSCTNTPYSIVLIHLKNFCITCKPTL